MSQAVKTAQNHLKVQLLDAEVQVGHAKFILHLAALHHIAAQNGDAKSYFWPEEICE